MNKQGVDVKSLKVKFYLLDNIKDADIKRELSYLIDSALNSTEKYKEFHSATCVKYYSFSKVTPYESDYIYKADNIYSFELRTVNTELCDYLKETLKNIVTDTIKVLTVVEMNFDNRIIEKLYNITPTVLTFFKEDEEGVEYWENSKTLVDVLNRIQESLIIRYNEFYKENLSLDTVVFNSINRKNKFPIPQKYKNVRFSTDMFELFVDTSADAQKIASFACAVGVGAKSSRGFGFVNPKRMDFY